MYSIVLATMIAAGSTTPAFCHLSHFRCHSSSYVTCATYSCHSACYSGYAGYSGYSNYGCNSSFHSYHHRPLLWHYHGHYSTYVNPCSTGCARVYYAPCTCVSSFGVPPTANPAPRVVPVPKSNSAEIDALRRELEALRAKVKKSEPVPAPKQQEEGAAPGRNSKIVVSLPADAKLFVDNVECPLTGGVRTFNTPDLDPARVYMYTMRVELARDGQTVRDAQQITIVPGVDIQVNFNKVVQTVAR